MERRVITAHAAAEQRAIVRATLLGNQEHGFIRILLVGGNKVRWAALAR